MDMNKVIWEGWTVQDFIDALAPQLDIIMNGRSWKKPMTTKADLRKWCGENQPYYKKPVPEVVKHFADRYGIKK